MKDLFHIDPLQILILIGGLIGMYLKFFRREILTQEAVNRMTAWQEHHAKDCDDNRKGNSKLLIELQVANAKLAEIAASNIQRIDRVETRLDDAVPKRKR